uniref:Uncharacterized protein n=1 Tax=Arundo donax TaxID=35708 RepID=A0A0A9BL09_ARUDO
MRSWPPWPPCKQRTLPATRVRLPRRPQSLSGTCPAARRASPRLGCQHC